MKDLFLDKTNLKFTKTEEILINYILENSRIPTWKDGINSVNNMEGP